jgi:hypothetical protein
MEVPSQTVGRGTRWISPRTAAILSGRFVKIWNVCWFASAMTPNTLPMNSRDTLGWNRSLIELTNTNLGLPHVSGRERTSSWRTSPKPGPLLLGLPSAW